MGGFATRFGLLRMSQVSSIDRTSQYRRSEPTETEAGGPQPLPPASPPRGAPPRQRRRLILAASLTTVGVVLLLGSIFAGWWTLTLTQGGGTTVTTSFLPGNQYYLTCSGTGCAATPGFTDYSSGALGAVGNLYGAVQVLLILSVLLGLVVVLVGWAGVLGYGVSRRRFLLGCFTLFLAFGLGLGAVIAVTAFQTSALQQDGGGIPTAAPSPLSSFWGSCSASNGASDGICQTGQGGASVTAIWGPALGWALAVAAVALLLLGFIELIRAGPMRRTSP